MFRIRIKKVIATIVLAVCVPNVTSANASESPDKSATEVPAATVRNANEFACNLYGKASLRPGNLFFSPASIASVLGMLEAGANGSTKEELRSVLRIKDTASSKEVSSLNQSGDGFILKSANRIWGKKGLRVNDLFRSTVKSRFGADVIELDFTAEQNVIEKINDWGDEATNGKIPKMLADSLGPDVELLLTNAIYFKGRWKHRFDAQYTENKTFYASGKYPIETPTMVQTNEFPFWESSEMKMIELPYEGDTMSAVLILAVNREGLPPIEKQLTSERLREWFVKLDNSVNSETKASPKVSVRIPRFRLAPDMPLDDELLTQLGLKTLFTKGHFNGIAEGAKLTGISHKALIQIDESGTVAAGTTNAVIGSSRPATFWADHPFIFIIRDRKSGIIPFIGRFEVPVSDSPHR